MYTHAQNSEIGTKRCEKDKESPTKERYGHWNLKINSRVDIVGKRINKLEKTVLRKLHRTSTERLRDSKHRRI